MTSTIQVETSGSDMGYSNTNPNDGRKGSKMTDETRKLATAKISHAIGFELRCPVDPVHEVSGPWGRVSFVYTDEFAPGEKSYCNDCGIYLSMPRIPKRVPTVGR